MTHLLLIVPKPRVFRDRTQPVLRTKSWSADTSLTDLRDLLATDLEDVPTDQAHCLYQAQILTALCYFATSSFQRVDGDLHGVSQSSVSRCANAVANALSHHASQFIRFPTDEARQHHIKAVLWHSWIPECLWMCGQDEDHHHSTESERACLCVSERIPHAECTRNPWC